MATHVLIIGGGIIGLATAFRLAQRHARVTLLERDTLFSGASGHSLGALWPSRPAIKGPLQTLQRKSLWLFEEFLGELRAASACPVLFRRPGHLELLTDEQARINALADASAAVDWPTFGHVRPLSYLAPDEVRVRFPHVTATDFGALHSHVTAQVDLPSLATALRAACLAHGVAIHEHTPATGLAETAGRIAAALTPSGPFAADAYLVAAGAWTAQLHPLLAASAKTKPSKGQALEIELSSAAGALTCIVRQRKTYIVPWPRAAGVSPALASGTAFIGSTTEPEAGFDTTVYPEAIAKLLASAQAFLPALAGAKVLRAWAGLRPDARKHQPIMGLVPGATNLYVAAGHFKTGIGLSPLVSQALAAMLLCEPSPHDLSPFAPRA